MLTEHLHRTMEELERLSPEAQEEVAAQLEAILQREQQRSAAIPPKRPPLDLIGAWRDIPWEEMEAELDRIRHESTPTMPIDLDETDDSPETR